MAGVGLGADRPQAELPHQPTDAMPADQNALALEHLLQAPAAIHRVLGEEFVEPLEQVDLLL